MRDDTDSAGYTARSVVVDPAFDWEGDRQLGTRWRDTVIYELHVKGFTKLHDRVPEHLRGTYAGLAEPAVVEYLRDLGVTAVELLPVQQFFSEPALLERGLTNYWGYNTISYFAPDASYSSAGDRGFYKRLRAAHGRVVPHLDERGRRSRSGPSRVSSTGGCSTCPIIGACTRRCATSTPATARPPRCGRSTTSRRASSGSSRTTPTRTSSRSRGATDPDRSWWR